MKKQIYHSIAAAICVSLFSACAGGTPYSEAKNSGALAPRNGKGMVLIYRTPGFVSAAYKPYLYVNGVELPSRLPRGGFYSFEATPGPLTVAYSKVRGESTAATQQQAASEMRMSGALMDTSLRLQGHAPLDYGALGLGTLYNSSAAAANDQIIRRKVGLNIQVQPGRTNYVYMGGAGGDLHEASQETGEEEIESCHWLNPAGR